MYFGKKGGNILVAASRDVSQLSKATNLLAQGAHYPPSSYPEVPGRVFLVLPWFRVLEANRLGFESCLLRSHGNPGQVLEPLRTSVSSSVQGGCSTLQAYLTVD